MIASIYKSNHYHIHMQSIFRFIKYSLAVSTLIVFVHGQSMAETVMADDLKNANSRFFRYINAYIVSSALYDGAVKTNANMHFECAEEYKILPGEMTILQPITFAVNLLHPISGAWHHRYIIDRCNKKITYNTYVVAKNNSPPTIIPGMNGDSNVPFSSLFDITVAVYTYMNYHYAPCPDGSKDPQPFIHNTELIHTTNENANQWQERWTVAMCNDMVTLNMTMHNKDEKLGYQIEAVK